VASILAAAAGCYAADGYDATSMRQVAAAAGVDPVLVRRFFGGNAENHRTAARVQTRYQPPRARYQLVRVRCGATSPAVSPGAVA
jgi:Bacterial regulatory proteins, tetR family